MGSKSIALTAILAIFINGSYASKLRTQDMAGLKNSLQLNIQSWLGNENREQQQSMNLSQLTGQQRKHRHQQQKSLNLAQTRSNSESIISMQQLQQLLSMARGKNGEEDGGEITPEMQQALVAAGQTGADQPSPEEIAQAQAQAMAEAQAAQAQPAAAAAVPAQAQLSAEEQAQVEAQAQAEVQAQQQAQAGAVAAQPAAVAGVDPAALAQAQAQAEAEAQAQAQMQLQTGAEQTAEAAPPRGAKIQVADSEIANHAAAVAAAANALFVEEKPWAKMNAAEKQAKLAKDAADKKAKEEKEARENPTVDENGEHIQTVAEARAEAAQLQQMLVAGEQAVEQKIQLDQARMAAEDAMPKEPVKQEEDDGHLETVEEAKAKMEAAQKAMEQGIAETDNRVAKMQQEEANMPNFSALANVHDTLSNMGKMRKRRQVQDLATKLGVDVQAGDEDLAAEDLTNVMMQRATQAGKSEAEINAALAE